MTSSLYSAMKVSESPGVLVGTLVLTVPGPLPTQKCSSHSGSSTVLVSPSLSTGDSSI